MPLFQDAEDMVDGETMLHIKNPRFRFDADDGLRRKNRRRRQRRMAVVQRRKRSLQHSYGCRKACPNANPLGGSKADSMLISGPTDLSELSLGSTMRTEFPKPDDILNFTLTIEPDEGMYKGGFFNFSFAINQNFPHDPPKVKCTQTIYHPNIDLEGNVCLNILREDWKPVLNLNAVIVGLQVSSSRSVLIHAAPC